MDIQKLIRPYCPWHDPAKADAWRASIPGFRRPVFDHLVDDLRTIPQIVQLTGPRRVGKSTLLSQIVLDLLDHQQVQPERVVYYDFGDPALLVPSLKVHDFVEALFEQMGQHGQNFGPSYLFLDEIQKLANWELFLKKYYDLKYPVRVVISGSASSPIFKKSRESLLGRVKDYHVLPFSFSEFLMLRLSDNPPLADELRSIRANGRDGVGMLVRSLDSLNVQQVTIQRPSDSLWQRAERELKTYLVQGGFPEVWTLPTDEKRMDYLFDNQVRKVIEEDLVLAAEFRKPEQLKTFYISLLERPGIEITRKGLAEETGVNSQQIEKYLPLLEMTDLLRPVSKFRKSALKTRPGNQKYYLVDLALRNAVLRIGEELLEDNNMLGLYAENLVFNALNRWPGVLQIDYYRERGTRADQEIDFIVHVRPGKYLPVEVKYRLSWNETDIKALQRFGNEYHCPIRLVITRRRDDFGIRGDVFQIPLLHFLMAFDYP